MKVRFQAVVVMLVALLWSACWLEAAEKPRFNVLFIAVDDLRPCFGVYDGPARAPNLDRLASRGTTFLRAYCQQAVCSPSRTSLLTGLRPDTTRVYELETHFRKNLPDAVTLPQHFKQQGYFTRGLSKIFHNGLDDPQSWSVPHWMPSAVVDWHEPATLADMRSRRTQLVAEGQEVAGTKAEVDPKTGTVLRQKNPKVRAYGPPWECFDAPDDTYPDGRTAAEAIQALQQVKAAGKPFFLAVGFLKPHLPFCAPKKYFDLYDRKKIDLARFRHLPPGVPEWVGNNSGELRSYLGVPKEGPAADDEQSRDLIRAYYAATSFMDAQLGKVLDEFDRLGLRDNTIVVLWGDHGWHLGEHGLWCKHTNFEEATRAPLIFCLPGQKQHGTKTAALVEFVDIYPTLCDAAGLPIPAGLAGQSFLAQVHDPAAPGKTAAFSQYPRRQAMGYSVRTDRWRYTEWGTVFKELYDQQHDPDETTNLADKPEHAGTVAELSALLRNSAASTPHPQSESQTKK
jgi:iduronate 2-sulfatase